MSFGISGDTYGYYKNGQLVGFKSQADIDAAYQSGYSTGYTAGQAAGVTNHTGTKNITNPYNGQSIDLGVHHSYRYISISITAVPWSSGDLVAIKNMLDDPNINIADYWSIGDFRTFTYDNSSDVNFNPNNFDWVITDMNDTTSGGTNYNAIIHPRYIFRANNCWCTRYKYNYEESYARTTVNTTFYNRLDSNLKSLIKTASIVSGDCSNSSTRTTNDNLWLMSEREVFGTRTNSLQAEYNACKKQFSYFTNSSNRIKRPIMSAVANNSLWWLRSPSSIDSNTGGGGYTIVCIVNNNGNIAAISGALSSYNYCPVAAI